MIFRLKPLFIFCTFLLTAILHAQEKAILIYESTSAQQSAEETSIFINPANPAQIVAGSNINFVFNSQDSGKTWEAKRIKSTYGVWGDPCILADATGRFYYFHLSDPTGKNWRSKELLDRMVCQRSDDGGKTWDDGTFFANHHPKDQDKEWAAVSPNTNNVAVTWTQFDKYGSKDSVDKSNILFTLSEDQGATWRETIQINELSGDCLDGDQTTEGAVPCFGPSGEIYVAWAFDEKIYFDYSLDKGNSWQAKDIFVANQNAGWDFDIAGIARCNGMPISACDISQGPKKGTIYLCWGDKETDSTNADVWFTSSKDGGIHWEPALRIAADSNKRDQFMPWMCVDPINGAVHIVFYDRSRFPNNNTDIVLASSFDGGQTWQNERLNKRPSMLTGNVFIGDYINISAHNGMVRPIWTEYHDGLTSIWTALLKF